MVKGILYISFSNQKVRETYRIVTLKFLVSILKIRRKNGGKSIKSIHAKFKPTWSRYNRSEGHTEPGAQLDIWLEGG